jgi:hypothetical protein
LTLGLNGIKVGQSYLEFAIDWLKEFCRIEFAEIQKLENEEVDVLLLSIQDFSAQLSDQINRITKPFDCVPQDSAIFKSRIQTVFFPFLYYDLKPILSTLFKKLINESLIHNGDENMDLFKNVLRSLFKKLECLDISKALEVDFIDIIQTTTDKMVRTRNDGEGTISDFLNLFTIKIDPILEAIYNTNHDFRSLWKQRLEFQIYRTHGMLLMERSFDIFRDFPDSLEQVKDLRRCVERTGEMMGFIRTIKRLIQSRLLIIDAKTSDILDIFLLFRKCLVVLTPSNHSRSLIMNPIKSYLQSRTDATKEILMRIIFSTDPEADDTLDEGICF